MHYVRLRQFLATLAYLAVVAGIFTAVLAMARGLDTEDLGAVFTFGPAALLYAVLAAAATTRPRAGAR